MFPEPNKFQEDREPHKDKGGSWTDKYKRKKNHNNQRQYTQCQEQTSNINY